MHNPVFRGIIAAFRSHHAWIGIAFAVLATARETGLVAYKLFPFPSLYLWLTAVAYLLWVIIAQQLELTEQDGALVSALKRKPYVTFEEIVFALTSDSEPDNDAFRGRENVVWRQLMRALDKGEFESIAGFSRVRVIELDEQMRETGNRPILHRADLAEYRRSGRPCSQGTSALEQARLWAQSMSTDGARLRPEAKITLDRDDFLRWLRRFKRGAYEPRM